VVAYSNDVKIAALGVGRETLARHGAVSGETAREMALGALRLTGADCAVATTGVAGPGGGSPSKPVGTVWIAVASATHGDEGALARPNDGSVVVEARLHHFAGTRAEVMAAAVGAALTMLGEAVGGWTKGGA